MQKISLRTKTPFYGISLDPNDLVGKTIVSIGKIQSDGGRSYEQYIGIKCSDGSRVMIWGDTIYDPKPPLESMKESDFFTTDELVMKAESDIRETARRKEDARERDLHELERIKGRLGLP